MAKRVGSGHCPTHSAHAELVEAWEPGATPRGLRQAQAERGGEV